MEVDKEKMEKRLGVKPFIAENCLLLNTELGEYTEVGMCNYLENVFLDDYSYTGQFCILQNAVVGKFANIAAAVRIGATRHPIERPTLHHFTYRRVMYGFADRDDEEFLQWRAEQKTYIGHDTWIGHGAIIMPALTIGNGAVVGSGAVVTKDVAPYSIVAGTPAKPIKQRFPAALVEKLERIRWWDWSYETIRERLDDFSLPAAEFADKYYVGPVHASHWQAGA